MPRHKMRVVPGGGGEAAAGGGGGSFAAYLEAKRRIEDDVYGDDDAVDRWERGLTHGGGGGAPYDGSGARRGAGPRGARDAKARLFFCLGSRCCCESPPPRAHLKKNILACPAENVVRGSVVSVCRMPRFSGGWGGVGGRVPSAHAPPRRVKKKACALPSSR